MRKLRPINQVLSLHVLNMVRKELPKPTKPHKRRNRQSRQDVKRELRQWRT